MRPWLLALLVLAGLASVAIGAFIVWQLFQSPFTRGIDNKFGDQHLKTSVAVIELHKLRYGSYPEQISDLKFLGDWDPIALNAVSYEVNADRTRYCVTVKRGWVGKPNLNMPEEFWRGTGYDPALCR